MRKKTKLEMMEIESEKELMKLPMGRLNELIGWIEPKDKPPGTGLWTVTCAEDGAFYECKGQDTAEILSNLEQIKFMIFKLLKRR